MNIGIKCEMKYFVVLDLGYDGKMIKSFDNENEALDYYNKQDEDRLIIKGEVIQQIGSYWGDKINVGNN